MPNRNNNLACGSRIAIQAVGLFEVLSGFGGSCLYRTLDPAFLAGFFVGRGVCVSSLGWLRHAICRAATFFPAIYSVLVFLDKNAF